MEFNEFYQEMGLDEYPFTIFTTELEQDKTKDLFEPTTEHGPMLESFNANRSIIVLGERGVGKSAIKEDFIRKASDRIASVITNYETLSITPKEVEIYDLIIRYLLISIVEYLTKYPLAIFRLNKYERIYLSYLIYYYSTQESLLILKEKIEKIQHNILSRFISIFYNNTRSVLNYAGTVLENALKRYIAQNFGFIQFYDENEIHNFFPEYKLKTVIDFNEREITFREIERIADLAASLSKQKPSIIFDSIDEDSRIKNDEDVISKFIESLLSDTKLLSCPKLQLVYFIWTTPYKFIIDSVRSQKFYTPTIKWDDEHLIKVLNKRLSVFSANKIRSIMEISEFSEKEIFFEYFKITNGIPRDLWHYMNKVFEEQYGMNKNSKTLTRQAYDLAQDRMVKETNYYEYYPRKSNARADSMDIYSYFNYLYKLKKIEFSKSQFTDEAGAGGSASNYLVNMERIGLIEQFYEGKNIKRYRIRDKKIQYAISHNIDIRKRNE